MATSSEKPKKSLWGQEQWLPHAGLAAVGAIALAVFAVLAGWWGGLSRILIRELTPQLLLDTAGVLFLVILVLSYSLYRKIKVSSRPKIVAAEPPKAPQAQRLHPLQEKLLIHAANNAITSRTLEDIADVHQQESTYYFNSIKSYTDIMCSHQRLNDSGRAYLIRHGLMPQPDAGKKSPPPRVAPGGFVGLSSGQSRRIP